MRESPFGLESGSLIKRGRDFKVGLKLDSLSPSALTAALEKDPDNPSLNYQAGIAFESARLLDSALHYYRKSIQVSPQFAYPYLHQGRIQMAKGEVGPARMSYATAISLMESSPKAYELGRKDSLGSAEVPPYDYLATLFYQTGSEDSALMALEYSQEKGWKTDQMDLVQGWLWEAHGFLHKADSVYRRLVEKNPDNGDYSEALTTLGWKPKSRKGSLRPTDAEAIFAVSLLDPLARHYNKNAPLWMALGQAYFRRGMFGSATECFDSSLHLDSTLPGLNEKREAAFSALIREAPQALTEAESRSRRQRAAASSGDEQAPVIIPGTNALLGTYSVSWGCSPNQVRQAYPKKTFVTLPGGNLLDTFVMDGIKHEYLLAFKDGKLWGIRADVTDSAESSGDVFGRMLRIKTKISGEGKGTGEAACPGYKSFQGIIWENDDTFEFMVQFVGKEHQIRLVRMGGDKLPQNRRLCDLAEYLKDSVWK